MGTGFLKTEIKKLKEVSQVFYKKRKLFREKRDNAR